MTTTSRRAGWRAALLLGISSLLLLLPGVAAAQETTALPPLDTAAIDAYIDEQMDGSRIPGVALAIVEGSEIVYARGYGSAGDGRDVTPQTPFPIGSLIKSFTSLAIMQLVEGGQIDLDAPVQQYLPWFQVSDPDASARITVRHLLNQTSGFSRETGVEPLVAGKATTLEETVRDLADAKLNRPVGETYEYSNANFSVAALVVERVTSQQFGAYLNQHVLAPLGMVNSSAVDDATRERMTALYRYWFGPAIAVDDAFQPSHFPGEYLIASAEDMARYLAMYLDNGTLDGATLLSPEGIAQMLAPATNETTRQLLSTEFTFRYGMGWFAGPFGAEPDARWHLGELPYFNAWMVLQPELNRGVVVMINAGSQLEFANANEVMSRIPLGVIDIANGARPPDGIGLTTFYVYFDVAVALLLLAQVAALLRLARHPFGATARGWTFARRVAPLSWELLLGLGLVWFATLAGMGWRGNVLAYPDLTLVVLAVGSLWVITGITRILRLRGAGTAERQAVMSDRAEPLRPSGQPLAPSGLSG
jgi:CubicO group peptidase (beta-lactamase class C family)